MTKKSGERRSLTPDEQAAAANLRRLWDAAKTRAMATGAKFTQEQAAERMGWRTQGAVSQFLRGTIPLNLSAILKFAQLLECDPSEIHPDYLSVFGGGLEYNDYGEDFESDFTDTIGEPALGPPHRKPLHRFFETRKSGQEKSVSIDSLVSKLQLEYDAADPEVQIVIDELLSKYKDNPEKGKEIAKAIKTLLGKD